MSYLRHNASQKSPWNKRKPCSTVIMLRPKRNGYFDWHTPAELLRGGSLLRILSCQRVFSPHCIRIATVHFTLTMANSHILKTVPKISHYGQFAHFEDCAKDKINNFVVACKHEVNGRIQAHTTTAVLVTVGVAQACICTWGAIHTVTAAAVCHCTVLEYLCCHPSSANHDFV